MSVQYDAIIIGGGFTGVTAARELSQKGYKSIILEAKDRLGGRTWFEERLGRNLEIGGTWVHWFQPHVWAEITRYGLEIVPSPTPEKAYWVADNQRHEGTPDELFGKLDTGMNKLLEETRKYFPLPYQPLFGKNLKEVDHITVADKLNELNLTKEEYDLVYSVWALNFHGSPEEGGLTQAYRWAALSDNNWQLMLEICAQYKLVTGTKGLLDSIMGDAKADVQLSKVVKVVEKTNAGYRVVTNAGEEYTGKTVIVTIPLNILNSIEFKPSLSIKKREASAEGQVSKGVKYWAKVKGSISPFVAFAPADYPLNYTQYEYSQGEDSILVGFGADSTKLDPENRDQVEKALRQWLPDVEVIESTGHDWVADEFSGQTWPMHKNNFLTEFLAELQKSEEGVFIAGSDYADGWGGFIDGAIESAFTVTKKVDKHLIALDAQKNQVTNS